MGAIYLLGTLLRAVQKILTPIVNLFPMDRIGGVLIADIIAILLIVAGCFVLGLLVETRMGRAIGAAAENTVLVKLPGYTFFKRVTANLKGVDKQFGRPVLVSFDDNAQFGFLIDDGSEQMRTVFLPTPPGVATGTVIVVSKEQVRALEVSAAEFIQSLSRWGFESQKFLDIPPKGNAEKV